MISYAIQEVKVQALPQSLPGFYTAHHAEGIIVTAATAMTKMLRSFQPEIIVTDEASLLAEHAGVAVITKLW